MWFAQRLVHAQGHVHENDALKKIRSVRVLVCEDLPYGQGPPHDHDRACVEVVG
jgi:hypothetical protein